MSGITVASLGNIDGPNGRYQIRIDSHMTTYMRYDRYACSVYLNHKLDREAQKNMELVLTNEIKMTHATGK